MKLSGGPIATHRGDIKWPGTGRGPSLHVSPKLRMVALVHVEGLDLTKATGFWQCNASNLRQMMRQEVRPVVPYCPGTRAGAISCGFSPVLAQQAAERLWSVRLCPFTLRRGSVFIPRQHARRFSKALAARLLGKIRAKEKD